MGRSRPRFSSGVNGGLNNESGTQGDGEQSSSLLMIYYVCFFYGFPLYLSRRLRRESMSSPDATQKPSFSFTGFLFAFCVHTIKIKDFKQGHVTCLCCLHTAASAARRFSRSTLKACRGRATWRREYTLPRFTAIHTSQHHAATKESRIINKPFHRGCRGR